MTDAVTPTANYVVHYDILDAAQNVVSHGTCWSSEVATIEVGKGLTVKVRPSPQIHDPSKVIMGHGLARAQHYPTVEEQMGAIWKYLATLDQKKLPEETKDMLAKILGVKATFEKGAFYSTGDGSSPTANSRLTRVEV